MEIKEFIFINKSKINARLENALNSLDFHYNVNDVYKINKSHFRTIRNVGNYTIDLFFKLREEMPKEKTDSVVDYVVNQFKERSKRGIEKYGTTLQENNTDDFLQHFKEELMDAILYIQKLQSMKK
ncbi:hypothetical protein snork62_gp030 [Flavobacterium phage vB_FspS_snork6-2]|uniref:Uncharacterized protein n=8 Tax=Lillamyvirus TaxID=2843418 RepID=A0A6B9LAL5_9CAUD|nr:hypothetical protein HWC89_gp29 [Flavobacterium phage vB_FspS_hemulen6-1]YP_009855169.1 hypothetical protein HWC95_gp33 [Flavobacterium phage vB_FspS_sniff9-1]YP_009855242.1 hypothetical protein HWC96_gp32 [Flavobacterium phage vB_FspS_snork6-1]YP_009855381.1 hypothetical protein HWC98_gp26 [Flavobacterium phage vB_FspS_stinky9-1]QHB38860.1 hypothetical protein hemulen62_gp029 [Flavobacterium phage vB_FspS_hemulen6-2]QHB38930.1 hypothetical protein hemulen91_gp029 [Flavobacterium phage vB_F